MSGMVRTGAPVILPRSELTLHRAPPTRPARAQTGTPLKPLPEEWTGGRAHPDVTASTSSTTRDNQRSSLRREDYSPTASMYSHRHRSSVRRNEYSPTASMYSHRRQGSTISKSSSLARSLRTRSRPFYMQARTHMRSARRWANNFRRRVKSKGGVPLLTPARPRRRRPVVVASESCRQPSSSCSSSPRLAARNSPRVRATHRAASAAREVRWEATSGLAALLECGASAGSAAVAAAVRVCTAVVAMADAKLQQLRRSISSWSLSTIKKPKITIPKLKTPSLNLFTGRKKRNRVNPKDEEESAEDVKLGLLKVESAQEGDPVSGEGEDGIDKVGGGQVIHESKSVTGETQPTIVLTVHDHTGTTPDPQPPSPNPGLLAPNDDIEYIDSDDGEDERFIRGAHMDYSDQWFDCKGTLSRSREDLTKIGTDFNERPNSLYYEAGGAAAKQRHTENNLEETAPKSVKDISGAVPKEVSELKSPHVKPTEAKKLNTENSPPKINNESKGSHKARAWVQSLDDDTEHRVERWIEMQKVKTSASIPKSKSEIRLDSLDEPPGKWAMRNEIKLNATGADDDDEAYAEYLQNYNDKVECVGDPEKDDAAQRESLKRVFQVRGKLSNKTIVDSQGPSYKDTDIYIASTPFALANSSGLQDNLNESEDGINCGSIDLEPALELSRTTAETVTQNIETSPDAITSTTETKILSEETLTLKTVCPAASIPDIIINAPFIEKNEVDIVKEDECLNTSVSDDYRYSSPSTENTGEDSTLQEVSWSEESAAKPHVRSIQNQDLELYENELINNPRDEIYDNEPQSPSTANTENHEKGKVTNDESITQVIESEAALDLKKPDRKKKKISAANIPKSIKNFAGSIFSQQTDSKSRKEQIEEKDADKKKRRSRLSPFNKDYLFKNSSKVNTADGSSEKKKSSDESNIPKNIIDKDNNSFSKDADTSFTSEDMNPFIDQSPSSEQQEPSDDKYLNKVSSKVIVSDLPSSDSMKSVEETGRGSSESMEYISPIDSDEQKSISHESSPGVGNPFVEEDGLLIRKDALLAVKSMENDDTSTHYYSFLSAADDIQSPTKEPEQTSIPIQKNVQPLKEISVFHEPPRSSESAKLKCGKDETSSTCASDTSKSVTESDSQSTVKSDLQNKKAGDALNAETSPSHKIILPPEKPPMKILALEGHSPLCLPSPIPKEPVPAEVPKLKLTGALPQESQEPPKPSPRTKKGKYGYSTGSLTPTTPTAPLNTVSIKDAPSIQSSCLSLNNNVGIKEKFTKVIPQRNVSSSQIHKGETERKSGDSGYAGPGNNYYESEPIYWEISETKDAPPRPSPRGKKGQRTPSEQSLNVNSMTPTSKPITVTAPTTVPMPGIVPSSTTVPLAATIPILGNVPTPQENPPVPEWINKRAPIPSPRSKKQRSLQSLPTVVPTDETMETVKKKLQSMSSAPLSSAQVSQPLTRRNKKRVEEQFYSGKAASISYGFTQEPSIPAPPVRGKKASQMSLPGAMAVEEAMSRQQKRASLHEFGLTRSHEKGTAPRPPSVRRSRRRTTDPTQGITASAFRSAVQHIDADLMNLTDLLVAVGIGATSAQKSEEHLCGVLFSVHSLMGGTGGGTWTVSSSKDPASGTSDSCPDKKNTVTLAEVTKELQAAYQVTPDCFKRLVEQAKTRPTPEVQLHLNVKEAKDLRPKTVKGKTNSYATVVIPSSGETHRTRLQKNTLDPVWGQEFILRVNNLQKDVLRLEIWHEHDTVGVQQLTAVRDIKSFGRLVKGTTEQAKHQAGHLLGKVVLQIKSMSEGGADGWYPLEKDGELAKDRGNVRVEGKVVSTAQLDNEGRKSYDALLTRLVHHQLSIPKINNEESQWCPPWNGRVTLPATAALAQHAIMLGLSEPQLQLSWWLVGSRVDTVDAVWALSQLHKIQSSLAKGAYDVEEIAELRSSLSYFVRAHAERLKDLHVAFPSSSGVLAQSQLTYTLKALHSLQTHAPSRELLDQEMIPHIHEMVTSSINIHSKNWWTILVEEQLRGVKTADEQITRVIKIVEEAYLFLNQATVFYNAVFMKEMNIPYMQTTYLMVSKKINPCVRPLLMNIYNRMPAIHDHEDKGDINVQYALEVGTSLWQLYRNLGRFHTLSEGLPVEARSESGVREYHRWFSKGVMRWLELAICRALDMINKAVELDNFTPVDDFCDFSSSATDTTGIFHDVKIWWLKLMWPDPEHSAVLLAKILEDICNCGTTYSDLLRDKVDTMFNRQASTDRVFITQQICVGLNDIERVRRELTGLPGHFGFDATLEEIRRSPNGIDAASQLEATVERLIISATENMESKVNEFIEAVIDKMKPTLDRALQEACDTQSEAPLLEQVLDPAIQLLHSHLHTSNFQRFLWNLWEILIILFDETVSRNAERRKATYFGIVHNLLEASLKFFSPDEGIGLDPEEARTKEYTAVLELLDSLRMSTDSLISKYYQERHEEQGEASLPSRAQLVVKMLFTRPGKLIVEVIMARDMVTEGDGISISSKGGGLHPNLHSQPVDSYVKVQLVPQEWFPSATERKTRTQRKADPAVYEETFEYDMSRSDDGVRAGLLLLTLKDYNLGRSNTFIGEALVPLVDLPCVDSSQVHTVPNTYLKMTTPGLDFGYKSLRALHLRTGDKMASSFLKKVSKRLPDAKGKGLHRPDDDRSRPKSPNLIDRFKFT